MGNRRTDDVLRTGVLYAYDRATVSAASCDQQKWG